MKIVAAAAVIVMALGLAYLVGREFADDANLFHGSRAYPRSSASFTSLTDLAMMPIPPVAFTRSRKAC